MLDWLGLYLVAALVVWGLFYRHTEDAGFSAVFAVLWPLMLVGMLMLFIIAPEKESQL